ncbi:MAG: MATE family efflux transporter [Actinobacteria bacterium]|nr:MATE family efflux transporter [Actinomycetota bacterium]
MAGRQGLTRINATDRAILGISVPALGALAIDPLLTLTDTGFVARVGTTELAALGVSAAVLTPAFFVFNFLAFVTTPLVAKAMGASESDRARQYVGTALTLAVILGSFVTVLLLSVTPWLVSLVGAQGDVAVNAAVYLRIRALASVATLVVITGHGAFRGHKDTKTPLLVALGVNGINLVLDPLLIFTLGMGLRGAAWATVAAQVAGAATFLILIRRRNMAFLPRSLAESLPSILTLGRNGVLLTLRSAFLVTTFAVAASAATRLGVDDIAAHQLLAQLFLLAVLVADSLEIAGQALVAEETGRRDLTTLRALTRRLLGWGVVVGLSLAVLVGLGRYGLAALASEETVGRLAVSAGAVAAVIMPVGALVFVADGIFVGLLSLGTMAMSTAAGALVSIPLLLWSPLGESLNGIWMSIGVFLLVRGLVFVAGYRRSTDMAVRS